MFLYKQLPLIAEVERLKAEADDLRREGDELGAKDRDKRAQLALRSELEQTIKTRGFQIVIDAIRRLSDRSYREITKGHRAEYHAGQLNALERLKEELQAILSIDFADEADEGLVEDEALQSPFLIGAES